MFLIQAAEKGLQTAAAAGICCGNADKELEVLSEMTEEQLSKMDEFLKSAEIAVKESDSNCPFDIQITLHHGLDCAYVRIIGTHTNVVCIRRKQQFIVDKPFSDEVIQASENRKLLNVKDIVSFADEADLDSLRETLKQQIDYNMTIAEAGMKTGYGANIVSELKTV